MKSAEERFFAKVVKTDSCWLWTGSRDVHGYGRFWPTMERQYLAHRYSYELILGPIPDGFSLDHLCRVPSCVYPAHLEPVTHAENMRRGGQARRAARNGNRLCGHPWEEGTKRCAECHRVKENVRYARKRGEGFIPIRERTHCKHGHEFTPENTYLNRGKYRQCRTCASLSQQRLKEARHNVLQSSSPSHQ